MSRNDDRDDFDPMPARNARYGLRLFAAYLLLYGGFMGLNVAAPGWMAAAAGGINRAILYGLALILAALALAVVYVFLCRKETGNELRAERDSPPFGGGLPRSERGELSPRSSESIGAHQAGSLRDPVRARRSAPRLNR